MLFNIDEKQLMLELKNKDERALKNMYEQILQICCIHSRGILLEVLCHMKTRRRSCLNVFVAPMELQCRFRYR